MYPELSGLELELGLEAGDEGVLLEVKLLDV